MQLLFSFDRGIKVEKTLMQTLASQLSSTLMQTLASQLSCKLSLLNSHANSRFSTLMQTLASQLSCKLSLLNSHQLSCKLSLLNSHQLSMLSKTCTLARWPWKGFEHFVLDSEEIKTEHYEKATLNPQVIYDDSATLSKVQHLSHMVWDLLMFLPTNFSIRNNLETFGHSEVNVIIS
jgi:hypothetical protein